MYKLKYYQTYESFKMSWNTLGWYLCAFCQSLKPWLLLDQQNSSLKDLSIFWSNWTWTKTLCCNNVGDDFQDVCAWFSCYSLMAIKASKKFLVRTTRVFPNPCLLSMSAYLLSVLSCPSVWASMFRDCRAE